MILHCLLLHALHEPQRILAIHNIDTTRLVRVCHAIASVSHKDHLRSERCADKLTTALAVLTTLPTQLLQHISNSCAVLSVEIGVDFIEEIEGRWVALLNREDKGECAEGFLTTRQLADFLLLVVLGIEGYNNANGNVFFDFAALLARLLLLCILLFAVVIVLRAVRSSVDDEATCADGDEFLENALEGRGDLLERAGDGFVFAVVEDIDEVLDRLSRRVEFGAAVGEGFALACEVLVLFVGLLVDVCELLPCLGGFGELPTDLSGMVSYDSWSMYRPVLPSRYSTCCTSGQRLQAVCPNLESLSVLG